VLGTRRQEVKSKKKTIAFYDQHEKNEWRGITMRNTTISGTTKMTTIGPCSSHKILSLYERRKGGICNVESNVIFIIKYGTQK